MESLPIFRYFPDPVANGMVRPCSEACICCGLARGYLYEYLEDEHFCPWCIAEGFADERFNTEFSYPQPLIEAGVPADIVELVTRRTPGYNCFQGARWMACCGDACEFHGSATMGDLRVLSSEDVTAMGWTRDQWQTFFETYDPKYSEIIFYRFVCRHCGRIKFNSDCG